MALPAYRFSHSVSTPAGVDNGELRELQRRDDAGARAAEWLGPETQTTTRAMRVMRFSRSPPTLARPELQEPVLQSVTPRWPTANPLADTCRLVGVGHRGGGRREGKLGDKCCGKRCCAGGGFVRGGLRTEHSPNCRRLLTQKSLGKSLADRLTEHLSLSAKSPEPYAVRAGHPSAPNSGETR